MLTDIVPLSKIVYYDRRKKKTKKEKENIDTLGVIVRTAEQIYIKLCDISIEQHNDLSVLI